MEYISAPKDAEKPIDGRHTRRKVKDGENN
jgi:hypothetical protein